jgi:hypothetical protein
MPDTPFESLESAHRYISLLREAVTEAQGAIQDDIRAAADGNQARHLEALRLVDHKLAQLGVQLRASGRILNDLRMLHRVLVGEPTDDQ